MNHDVSAWVRQTAPGALAYASTLVRDHSTAEDLVQDCYQRLLAKADDYDLVLDGTKLLYKSITNACINWTQRAKPTFSLSQVENCRPVSSSAGDGPLQRAMGRELGIAIDGALCELPVDQRAAVELHALGHSTADVAEMLDTTEGNVRVLRHRGREQLKLKLAPYFDHEQRD